MALWAAFAALSVAGSAMNAYGQIQKGDEAKRASEEAARMYELDAKYAAVRGADEISSLEGRMWEYLGGQRQAAGVSNVKLEGSPMEQLLRTITITENDIARTNQHVAIEQQKLQYQAMASRRAGAEAQTQSRYAAAGSLLSGIGGAGAGYYQGQALSGLQGTNPVTGTSLPSQ